MRGDGGSPPDNRNATTSDSQCKYTTRAGDHTEPLEIGAGRVTDAIHAWMTLHPRIDGGWIDAGRPANGKLEGGGVEQDRNAIRKEIGRHEVGFPVAVKVSGRHGVGLVSGRKIRLGPK